MEITTIKSKLRELSQGDREFEEKFVEMSIQELEAFPRIAADALKNRDLRRLTQANHKMKTLIGLFSLNKLGIMLDGSLELFEKGDNEKKAFLLSVQKEIKSVVKVIRQSVI